MTSLIHVLHTKFSLQINQYFFFFGTIERIFLKVTQLKKILKLNK